MRRGILGGSFDPIHIGHLRLAIEAQEQLGLDEVILEVARVSPLKTGESSAPANLRLEMVRAATADLVGIRAGDTDLRREPPSYTVDLLEAHAAPGVELTLIVGCDSLLEFHLWKDPERIAELASIAAAKRPGYDARSFPHLSDRILDAVTWLSGPAIDISSTVLREKIRTGKSVAHLIPPEVVSTIVKHRLYE